MTVSTTKGLTVSTKNFVAVAAILKDHEGDMPRATHESLVREFGLMFKDANPRFDGRKFAAAAGAPEVRF
jgi:hypothetical protein